MPVTEEELKGRVEVPEGVEATIDNAALVVRGPKGTARKDFDKIPVGMEIADGTVRFKTLLKGKKGYALRGTVESLIENLITGVTKGFVYKMKVYYAHFPISVRADADYVYISNFGGERADRRAPIVGDTRVEVEDEIVTLTGPNKEDVAQTAANVEQACIVKEKDPRIFLDGIYVFSKGVQE